MKNVNTTRLDNDTILKETTIFKELTIKKLRNASAKKVFFRKKGFATIFPMDSVYGVVISGQYNSQQIPLVNELRVSQIINILGKTGWIECEFIKA